MKDKKFITLIILAIFLTVIIVATISNPSEQDFTNYVFDNATKIDSPYEDIRSFKTFHGITIESIFTEYPNIDEITTTKKNYVIFSIYGIEDYNSSKVSVLGILGNFFILEEK